MAEDTIKAAVNVGNIFSKDKKLKILFLTARFPYPLIGGDRVKPYHTLRRLSSKHDVTLVTFYQGGKIPEEYMDAIRKLGVELYVIPLNPLTAGMRALFKTLGGFPLEIGYYLNSQYRKTVESLAAEKNFDIAFAFFMRTAEYIKSLKIKKVLVAEDCRSLYQKRSYEESGNLKQKLVRGWEYRKLKKYEPEIVNFFDTTTLVTDEDIAAMKIQNDSARYRLLTNGADISKFIPPSGGAARKGILFSGKLDVWANVLMAENIVKNILPAIRKEAPGTMLDIVGANPPKAVLNMENDFVKVHANVPSVIPYLQKAELFLHPHTGGSGIQNKLLEAMACACPVVTTHTGIQGISVTHAENVMLGKNNAELAALAVSLLKNKDLAASIGDKAREKIVMTHSWESVFASLDEIIDELFMNN